MGSGPPQESPPPRPEVPRSIFRAARPTSATLVGRAAVPAKWIALPYTRARRRRLAGATVVCVTGSVGKTTTAHLLEAVLGCPANPRPGSNRARAIVRGVRAASVSGFVVQEIGAAGPGTLDELLWALEPDVAVVTAVASDHLGAFRTLEAVEREKAKAVAAVPPGGLAVLNADDPRVLAMRGLCRGRVVTFGESDDADVRIEGIRGGYPEGISFTAVTRDGAFDVRTQLLGRHLAGCAAAAFACALVLGLDPSRALAALAETAPVPHRLSLLPTSDGPTFLLDDRKASITTVAPGLAALEHATHAGRKSWSWGTCPTHEGARGSSIATPPRTRARSRRSSWSWDAGRTTPCVHEGPRTTARSSRSSPCPRRPTSSAPSSGRTTSSS